MPNKTITVEVTVQAPLNKIWSCWTEPEHITHWAFASDDWEAPTASNDVQVGGRFATRMQAKDGSVGFDLSGTYTAVEFEKLLEYTMDDNRTVRVEFAEADGKTRIIETFEMETENSEDMQRAGWQAILTNFKKYTETLV